jgi:hypothetical protein
MLLADATLQTIAWSLVGLKLEPIVLVRSAAWITLADVRDAPKVAEAAVVSRALN